MTTNHQQELIKRAQRWGMEYDPECVTESGGLVDELIAEIQRLDRHMERLGSEEWFAEELEDRFDLGKELTAMAEYARANRYEDE